LCVLLWFLLLLWGMSCSSFSFVCGVVVFCCCEDWVAHRLAFCVVLCTTHKAKRWTTHSPQQQQKTQQHAQS
jgi:hypothetical protein